MLAKFCERIGECELCHLTGVKFEPHHIKSRGAGGTDDPSNILVCCRLCHEDVQHHRVSPEVVAQALANRGKIGRKPLYGMLARWNPDGEKV